MADFKEYVVDGIAKEINLDLVLIREKRDGGVIHMRTANGQLIVAQEVEKEPKQRARTVKVTKDAVKS